MPKITPVILLAMSLPHLASSGVIALHGPADVWSSHKTSMLAVGINVYKDRSLRYAAQDAMAMAEAFGKLGVETTTLVDGAATEEGIEKAIAAQAQQLRSEDTFILQFSGYGMDLGKGFYLKASGIDPAIPDSGIPAARLLAWLDHIQARHLLIILDSGDASDFLSTVNTRFSGKREDQADRDIVVIGSQGAVVESTKLEHGQMTYALLKALTRDSDLNGDGFLSAAELEAVASVNAIRVQTTPADGIVSGLKFRLRSFSSGKDFAIGKLAPGPPSRGTATYREENPPPGQTLSGKYHALVIATNDYKYWNQLKNPINDARSVADSLTEKYGFQLVNSKVVENPDSKTFRDSVATLKTMSFGPDDELFIFIAGHGTYDKDEKMGYLIAKDSQKDDLGHENQISESWIFKVLAGIPAKHVFVVIDACQSGAEFLTRSDNMKDLTYQPSKKLEVLTRKKSWRTLEYLTSGGNEYVPDGEGQHSPFTAQFLRALASDSGDPEGIITIRDIVDMVNLVGEKAPLPRYGRLPDGEPGADFWFVAKPELRGDTAPQR